MRARRPSPRPGKSGLAACWRPSAGAGVDSSARAVSKLPINSQAFIQDSRCIKPSVPTGLTVFSCLQDLKKTNLNPKIHTLLEAL